MQVDLTDFQNVKVIATIDQTFYRNVSAIILYEEDSHTLSVRKLTRKTVDHYIPTDSNTLHLPLMLMPLSSRTNLRA